MNPAWDQPFYRTAYEGFEVPENFPDAAALADYRALLLRKSELQVAYIRRLGGQRRLRVLEYCSGNGRLLIALALAGALEAGIGIEISASRSAFARRWAEELGLSQVEFCVADVLDPNAAPDARFDVVAVLTGAFQYFHAIAEAAPAGVLRAAAQALQPDGALLLELYQLDPQLVQMLALSGGELRLWHELPPADRFAYYLDHFRFFAPQSCMQHGKVFIGRNGAIDAGRVEVLRYYTPAEIAALLTQNGFRAPQLWGDFAGRDFAADQDHTLVVAARPRAVAATTAG